MQTITPQQNFEIPITTKGILPQNIEMLWVSPGQFEMGLECTNELPFNVEITEGFWLSKYPVTKGQWYGITQSLGELASFDEANKNHPYLTSWENINIYLSFLNTINKQNFPEGYQFGLVTEAQWEYAQRSGGKEMLLRDLSTETFRKVAYHHSTETWKVGQKEPNSWGFHDMRGHYSEWCFDVSMEFPTLEDDPEGIFSQAGVFQDWCANNWMEVFLKKHIGIDIHSTLNQQDFEETLASYFSQRVGRWGGEYEGDRAYKHFTDTAMFRICLRKKQPFDESDLIIRQIKKLESKSTSATNQSINKRKRSFWKRIFGPRN